MLEINYILFIQIANFLLLLVLMNILLFRPIRGILKTRSDEVASFEESIGDLLARSEQNEKRIEESMVEARKEGYLEREKYKGEGLAEERGILEEANGSYEEKVGAAKQEIEKKMSEVRETLEGQIAAFSNELAEKILGRSVQ